jgi:hypothetical protein
VFLYLVDLYVFLITHGFFDARGRVLLRNATSLLHVPREMYFGLEVALAESLHDCEERLARVAAEGSNSQVKRYLKIGAVGLGAGAVIALTGGLAAPAVAAALVVIGGGAAAAVAGVATFAVLASVFGTAGAGLAGYKMVSHLLLYDNGINILNIGYLFPGSPHERSGGVCLRTARKEGNSILIATSTSTLINIICLTNHHSKSS